MESFDSLDSAWQYVISRHERDPFGIHGPRHWAVVERNGLYLARHTGADRTVVSLFALFHDSRRINDDYDPEHGPRGAVYALELWGALKGLLNNPKDFDLLVEACDGHTNIIHHENPTIATCWDADRLDLGRVFIPPHPKYLNTETAKTLAASDDLSPLDAHPTRAVEEFFAF